MREQERERHRAEMLEHQLGYHWLTFQVDLPWLCPVTTMAKVKIRQESCTKGEQKGKKKESRGDRSF